MNGHSIRHLATPLVLSALIAIAAAANLGKAVHIDDTAYVDMARGILHSPMRPMSVILNWGDVAEPAWRFENQPPLFSYLLAAVIDIVGPSELALHALMALVSALAILLFHRVARRTGERRPLLLTTLFALGPAFLPGQNVMTDVPLVLAWLVCFDALLSASGRGAFDRHYVVAAVAIAAACLTKYSSLALMPAFSLVVIYRRRFGSLWLLAIPLGVLCGWSAWNYLDYGGVHILGRETTLQAGRIRIRALEWMAGLGVAEPFGVVFWAQRSWRRLSMFVRALPVVVGALVFARARSIPCPPFGGLLWGITVCVGLISVLFIAGGLLDALHGGEPVPERDVTVVTTVWLLAAFSVIVVLAPFLAMRHVLLAMPPLLLLCGRFGERTFARAPARVVAVGLTAGLALAIAASDYAYADVYRQWAPRLAASAATATTPGHTTFAVGHWGWQWYAAKSGMKVYDAPTMPLRSGDVLVIPRLPDAQALKPEDGPRLRLVRSVEVPSTPITWLRTVNPQPRGGYYGFRWSYRSLPFSFSREPLEVFKIYVVE